VISDLGKVRQGNEDAYALLPDKNLFIVSDGMGGEQAGTKASEIVVKVLPPMVEQRLGQAYAKPAEVSNALRDAIVELSRQVREQSAGQPRLAGMGATVVLAYFLEDQVIVANMGDSRAYLYRNKRLKQLTEDHSVVGILLRRGEINEEQALDHPARHQISRYIGMEGEVYPDVRAVKLSAKDRFLLCSDGLTGMVADVAIARLLEEWADPDLVCGSLVSAANAAGGRDNITALVVDWLGLTPAG
jgi:protein phosphatase